MSFVDHRALEQEPANSSYSHNIMQIRKLGLGDYLAQGHLDSCGQTTNWPR